MTQHDGRARLVALVEPPRLRVSDVARAVGVTAAAVSAWTMGKRTPSERHRRALERLYGIPRDSWGER